MQGKHLSTAHTDLKIPAFLRNISAAVVVIVDADGFLMDANLGFAKLIGKAQTDNTGMDVRQYFVQPSFYEISSIYGEDPGTPLYEGLLNIGDPDISCRSFTGSVFREANKLLIIGEYDIDEMEQLSATVIQLNDEMTQLQRDLVRTNRDLQRNEARITELMLTDPMTEIPNRRHFDQQVEREIDRHLRYRKPLSFVMCDLDLFKSVNDTYGHAVGDIVIRHFAHVMRDNKRSSDFVARIGGEEFILLLPETSVEEAFLVIDRLRLRFSNEVYEGIDRSITASFGITGLLEDDTLDELINRADKALYSAKKNGRNQVSIKT
jgi:diguanylate cyclase (GGDEF)-like protein